MVVVAGLRAAAPFLVPLVLALFLTTITLPLLQALRRLRIPTPAAVLLVVLATFGFMGLVGLVGYVSLDQIGAVLPLYVDRIAALEHGLLETVEGWGLPVPNDVYAVLLAEPARILDLMGGVVRGAASLLSYTAIVALYVVFMLLEATGFPGRLRMAIGSVDADFRRYARAVRHIQRYLAIKTMISLVTGALVALWLWVVGIDFPLLWGAIAFLLNYVPNVGSLVAAAPAVAFALLQLGPGAALLSAVGYLVINIGLGNLLEPQLMGRGFGLSTLVVVVSLVFWGWLWGPVGMILSVPLTVILRIALEHTQDLRWLARLLGGETPPTLASPASAPAGAGAAGEQESGGPDLPLHHPA